MNLGLHLSPPRPQPDFCAPAPPALLGLWGEALLLYFCVEGGAALSVPSAFCTWRAGSAWKQATGYLSGCLSCQMAGVMCEGGCSPGVPLTTRCRPLTRPPAVRGADGQGSSQPLQSRRALTTAAGKGGVLLRREAQSRMRERALDSFLTQ